MVKPVRVKVSVVGVLGAILFSRSLSPEPALAEAATEGAAAAQSQALAEAHDRALGWALAKNLMASSTPWGGSKVNNYAYRIALRIAAANRLKEPLVVRVLYSTQPRVMALSGGFLFVNSGVLSAAVIEDDVAAAVAHGIAHLHARRATGGYGRQAFEREADRLTEEYLANAGYEPDLAADMINLMESWRSGVGRDDWGYAHPFMKPQFSISLNSVEGLPQMKLVRQDQSEFQAVRSEVLQYDLVYARALGQPLPGEDRHPRLMRRPENTAGAGSRIQDSETKTSGL